MLMASCVTSPSPTYACEHRAFPKWPRRSKTTTRGELYIFPGATYGYQRIAASHLCTKRYKLELKPQTTVGPLWTQCRDSSTYACSAPPKGDIPEHD